MLQRLGTPAWQSPAGDSYVYSSLIQGGNWVMFPFIPIGRALQVVAVRLDFDADGMLRAARIERGEPSRASLLFTYSPGQPRLLRDLPRPDTRPVTGPTPAD